MVTAQGRAIATLSANVKSDVRDWENDGDSGVTSTANDTSVN